MEWEVLLCVDEFRNSLCGRSNSREVSCRIRCSDDNVNVSDLMTYKE